MSQQRSWYHVLTITCILACIVSCNAQNQLDMAKVRKSADHQGFELRIGSKLIESIIDGALKSIQVEADSPPVTFTLDDASSGLSSASITELYFGRPRVNIGKDVEVVLSNIGLTGTFKILNVKLCKQLHFTIQVVIPAFRMKFAFGMSQVGEFSKLFFEPQAWQTRADRITEGLHVLGLSLKCAEHGGRIFNTYTSVFNVLSQTLLTEPLKRVVNGVMPKIIDGLDRFMVHTSYEWGHVVASNVFSYCMSIPISTFSYEMQVSYTQEGMVLKDDAATSTKLNLGVELKGVCNGNGYIAIVVDAYSKESQQKGAAVTHAATRKLTEYFDTSATVCETDLARAREYNPPSQALRTVIFKNLGKELVDAVIPCWAQYAAQMAKAAVNSATATVNSVFTTTARAAALVKDTVMSVTDCVGRNAASMANTAIESCRRFGDAACRCVGVLVTAATNWAFPWFWGSSGDQVPALPPSPAGSRRGSTIGFDTNALNSFRSNGGSSGILDIPDIPEVVSPTSSFRTARGSSMFGRAPSMYSRSASFDSVSSFASYQSCRSWKDDIAVDDEIVQEAVAAVPEVAREAAPEPDLLCPFRRRATTD